MRAFLPLRVLHPEQLTAQFSALDPAQVEADAGNVQILSLEELDQLTEDGTVNTWLSGMVDYFVQAGIVKDPPDLDKAVDLTFVDYAISRLGRFRAQ